MKSLLFNEVVEIARNYLGKKPPAGYEFVTNCGAGERSKATHYFHPDYLVAEPRGTEHCSAGQLVDAGMVGIYRYRQVST